MITEYTLSALQDEEGRGVDVSLVQDSETGGIGLKLVAGWTKENDEHALGLCGSVWSTASTYCEVFRACFVLTIGPWDLVVGVNLWASPRGRAP